MVKVVLAVLALGIALSVAAAPIAVANQDGVVVTLTNEKCALSAVENLPYRATWLENGISTEGCYGAFPSLVMTYWADKTVVPIPVHLFQRAVST